MKNMNYWEVFEQTGSIDAYLHYACTSENNVRSEEKEGDISARPGDGYRDGIISGAYWGI